MEMVDRQDLTLVLSTLIHLGPFRAMDSEEFGFMWITEILNSGYEEEWRERMASEVVGSLGKHLFCGDPASFVDVQPAWVPPLLGFLSLSGKIGTTRSSAFIALRILATCPVSADLCPMVLPILHSTLLPNHHPQARHLALNIFLKSMSGWFSSQMENVPSKDLERLVQAVGDPFKFPDLPPQDGKPVDPPHYNPTMTTAVLIEFASSDLWRNYLRHSNFTSFEEMASTLDGKRTALRDMLNMTIYRWPGFLRTAAKIVMAIKRLEELQCFNTAEVVIMWAWTVGVVDPVDHDTWRLIGRDTLRFYQTHGIERMSALRRQVANTAIPPGQSWYLIEHHRGFQSEVGDFIKLPVVKLLPGVVSKDLIYLRLSQACQLRRLYHLVGYDPATWKEATAVAGVDKGMSVSSGRSVMPVLFVDWTCDYP